MDNLRQMATDPFYCDTILGERARSWASRAVIYGLPAQWAFISPCPIYWTVTASFKMQPDVMRGAVVPA